MSVFRMNRTLVVVLATIMMLPMTPLLAHRADAAQTFGSTPLDDVLHWAGQKKRCGLSTNELAALMLAPTFPETGATPTSSPSPMTLSRWDNQAGLHSFGSSGSYRNAFWHPGIGPWQFDSAGLGAYDGAQGRIDTFVAAAHAADTMAGRWCARTGSDAARRAYVWAPWYGCGSNKCETIFGQIFNGSALVNVSKSTSVSRTGGMVTTSCKGPGVSGAFPCWRVDPSKAQGYNAFAIPSWGQAPITAPFYVYTAGGYEYRHWLKADTGYDIGIWASRPLGANARTNLNWHSGQPLVDLGATPPPPGPGGFTDVVTGDWFVEGLLWAVDKGVMTGFPDDTFRPSDSLNRAQAVMAVWRSQGQPAASSDHGFVDVASTAWFDAALDWAAERGIVEGYPDGTFRAAEPLNRAQYVMMMWRLAKQPKATQAASFGDASPTHWYRAGMDWAVERGYMVGFGDNTFRAYDPMNRSQSVMAFWRGRQFDDVAVTESYAPAVDWARYRAVVNGFADHTYRPGNQVNRAQIVMILHALMDAPGGSPPNGFVDVSPTAWFVTGLDWATANGIVNGYAGSEYRPDASATRSQLIMMLWRLSGESAVSSPHGFSDVPSGAWYDDGARWAAANAILTGVASTSFEPDRVVDRAEMAMLLANLASSQSAWAASVVPPSTVIFTA